ncbi:MAG: dipeptidase [Bacteroidetes bacterium]|jgi:dipeptidase|nr:dipeptidase [Bacteroidota bacterium]
MNFKSFIVLIPLILIQSERISACTNFLVTKGATTDGSTMITYAADAHVLYGELYFYPAKDYPTGAMLDVYDWDTGKFLGKIKQVSHTYSVVGNMNEHQLSIAETTFGGREELRDSTGIIDYGSLMYITLQRAKTAREAIEVMTSLVNKYGYYSGGESFSIADPNEVWLLEMIGKGKGNTGAVWVARKVPDGYISGHANQARIRTFPLNDPENCMYADDVIDFARQKGYFKGKDKDFSFADAYAPIDFGGARFCEARVWSGFRRVNNNMEQYADYAKGENLDNRMPLWIKPDEPLSVKDVMELMRDHYDGTELSMKTDIGAGPFGCAVRWRPLVWKVNDSSYFNERAISTQQTGFSFVAQSRSWLPDPIGGILWFGVDDTYSTVYSPMYCGIYSVPPTFATGNGGIMDFSDNSAFWVFNQVSNLAYSRYSLMIPEIRQKQARLEEFYIETVPQIDDKAEKMYGL